MDCLLINYRVILRLSRFFRAFSRARRLDRVSIRARPFCWLYTRRKWNKREICLMVPLLRGQDTALGFGCSEWDLYLCVYGHGDGEGDRDWQMDRSRDGFSWRRRRATWGKCHSLLPYKVRVERKGRGSVERTNERTSERRFWTMTRWKTLSVQYSTSFNWKVASGITGPIITDFSGEKGTVFLSLFGDYGMHVTFYLLGRLWDLGI